MSRITNRQFRRRTRGHHAHRSDARQQYRVFCRIAAAGRFVLCVGAYFLRMLFLKSLLSFLVVAPAPTVTWHSRSKSSSVLCAIGCFPTIRNRTTTPGLTRSTLGFALILLDLPALHWISRFCTPRTSSLDDILFFAFSILVCHLSQVNWTNAGLAIAAAIALGVWLPEVSTAKTYYSDKIPVSTYSTFSKQR